jgi:hypothetical protein
VRHDLAQPAGGDPRLWMARSSPSSAALEVPGQRLDAARDALRQRRWTASAPVLAGWRPAAARVASGRACRRPASSYYGPHAPRRDRHRHQFRAHDRGAGPPDLSFEIVDREKEMVRLGAGGLDGRRLTPAAMAGGLAGAVQVPRLADSHKVDEIIAAATSATREAENGGDFLAAVRDQTGIDVKVISGTEEARLIHIAAAYGVDLARRRAVVIDIGGGSVEITLGGARDAVLARSFKVGVIRLTERFVRADPLPHRDERRLVKHVEEAIGATWTRSWRAATSASSAPPAPSSASGR